jgi:hypothetical protein
MPKFSSRTLTSVIRKEDSKDYDDVMPVDPNEPKYCDCNQVSFGEMIACDNEDVTVYTFDIMSTSN